MASQKSHNVNEVLLGSAQAFGRIFGNRSNRKKARLFAFAILTQTVANCQVDRALQNKQQYKHNR